MIQGNRVLHSLGVEAEGDRFIPLIKKHSRLPTSAKLIFTTIEDNQSLIEIHLLEGDNRKASGNTSLGRFLLSGIQEAVGGEPRIEIYLRLDTDGVLRASAKDLHTGTNQSIFISSQEITEKTSGEFSSRKTKKILRLLINKITDLALSQKSRLDAGFRQEIDDLISQSNRILVSGSVTRLIECKIALETILGELESIKHSEEERREQA